jgi:outer membrane receptor protein involved in Fe transport
MEAWNLPTFEASLFSNFTISEKLYGGVTVFFMGGRKDLFTGSNAVPLEIDLDAFVDANVHFGYHLNNRLSFFVKGNNLFGDTYQKWVNYQVQGIQVLAGASYKFDW